MSLEEDTNKAINTNTYEYTQPKLTTILTTIPIIGPSDINPTYFDKSYNVVLDVGAEKAFNLLHTAMLDTHKMLPLH